jgi:RNA polymerase sigma factor (sigma-70 family)
MRSDSTCWTLIQGAAAGHEKDRENFARMYAPAIRAYLATRWRQSPHHQDLEDAVQEVFLECFKQGGVLERVEPGRPGGFRAYLYGVLRNVAMQNERRSAGQRDCQSPSDFDFNELADDDPSLSRVFDRAWAESMLREALDRMATNAREGDEAARKRFELLHIRFRDGLPIREIAGRWEVDPTHLHRQYARACHEFKEALIRVVAFHQPGTRAEVEGVCLEMLDHLS